MERFPRIIYRIFLPTVASLIPLIPLSIAMLVYSFSYLDGEGLVSYLSYALSAYTFTVCCMRGPKLIGKAKIVWKKSRLFIRWRQDVRLRVRIGLWGGLVWNTAYAIMQLCLGYRHSSAWFYSLALYYIFLGIMRFYLVQHTGAHMPGDDKMGELRRYRTCGIIFLMMNTVLTAMLFFMIYFGRSFEHHPITAIALAAYTFLTFGFGVVNIFKYRKYNSPIYSAAKIISLAAACVSMVTLTSTMLTAFGGDGTGTPRKLMLSLAGGAASAFIISAALYMIIGATRQLRSQKSENRNE